MPDKRNPFPSWAVGKTIAEVRGTIGDFGDYNDFTIEFTDGSSLSFSSTVCEEVYIEECPNG